jgi:hypothetical protein
MPQCTRTTIKKKDFPPLLQKLKVHIYLLMWSNWSVYEFLVRPSCKHTLLLYLDFKCRSLQPSHPLSDPILCCLEEPSAQKDLGYMDSHEVTGPGDFFPPSCLCLLSDCPNLCTGFIQVVAAPLRPARTVAEHQLIPQNLMAQVFPGPPLSQEQMYSPLLWKNTLDNQLKGIKVYFDS